MHQNGVDLYKQIKSTSGDVSDVLKDLREQYNRITNPSKEQTKQFQEETKRVQEVAKAVPDDVLNDIWSNLGTFIDQYEALVKIYVQSEAASKEVYKGDLSLGRRALERIRLESKLNDMLAQVREQMVYNTPPELGSVWSRFEKAWTDIQRNYCGLPEVAGGTGARCSAGSFPYHERDRAQLRMGQIPAWDGGSLAVAPVPVSLFTPIASSEVFILADVSHDVSVGRIADAVAEGIIHPGENVVRTPLMPAAFGHTNFVMPEGDGFRRLALHVDQHALPDQIIVIRVLIQSQGNVQECLDCVLADEAGIISNPTGDRVFQPPHFRSLEAGILQDLGGVHDPHACHRSPICWGWGNG